MLAIFKPTKSPHHVIEDLETDQDWQCALRRANGAVVKHPAPDVPCGIDGEPLDGTTGYDVQYHCYSCSHEWTSQWSCACDDDCPKCGTTNSATHYELDGTATQEALDAFNAAP